MINNCRLGLYEKSMPSSLTWPEKLSAAKAAGFDYVEISVDESDTKQARLDMSASERLALTRDMSQAGIRIETMCLSGQRKYPLGSLDADVRKKSLDILHKAVVLAADLGIRIIQIPGYDEYYNPSNEQTRVYFGEGLISCVELAAQYGVILGFETMEPPFMNSVRKAMFWVCRLKSPYLQVYPDSGNITCSALEDKRSVVSDIVSGTGHIAAVHLKESAPGRYRDIPYGKGHVDFKGVIATARNMGVRLFTGEFWYTEGVEYKEYLAQNAAFLRNQFQ
jgi:L-ribulose-5-phosphate 3-epimerase